jgi:hypothetical protein
MNGNFTIYIISAKFAGNNRKCNKKALWWASRNIVLKAVDGFEPTIKLLQSRALPLGYTAATLIILS